jgi:DNA-binding SARP family transcriptional activator
LIASGTDGAPVERLTDMVWPGLEGDKARKAFSTALYRLRGLLGEGALVLNAGRLRIASESVWVDALAFEAAVATGAPTRESLSLYAGPLLGDEDEAWILPARNRLAEMHRNAICRLGEGLLARGRWREALEVFGAALQRDSIAEVFYQGALAACLAGGLRAEASALYERCRKEMSEQLGLSPSARTLELYRAVIRNH